MIGVDILLLLSSEGGQLRGSLGDWFEASSDGVEAGNDDLIAFPGLQFECL